MINYKKKSILVVIKIGSIEKYSREEILKQIKDYYLKNPDMNSRNFDKDKNTCSRSTIRIAFGSWGNALEEAGIPAREKNYYTKEKIVEHLWDHYKRNPKMTRTSFEKDKKVCSSSIIFVRFGGWEKALKAAGIPLNEITKEKILEQLKDHYLRNGEISRRAFARDKTVCSSSVVVRRFGSWHIALKEAGIREEKPYVEYDKEKLFEILKEKVKTGELKYQADIDKIKGIPSIETIENIWKWEELTNLLGLERKLHSYTDEMIIEKYKKVKREKKYEEKKLTSIVFSRESGVSSATLFKHFGGWNNFLRIMNEEIILEQSKVEHTNEEILEMYKEFSIEIGEDGYGAKQDDVDEEFPYKSGVLERRFKSLNEIRKILNYEVTHSGRIKYTKEILTKILLEKYKEYGRRLTQNEMREINKKYKDEKEKKLPGTGTFLCHFKTTKMSEVWEEVLKDRKL